MDRKQNADFERCCEFIARMIEKYGDRIEFPKPVLKTFLLELNVGERNAIDFTVFVDRAA